MTRGYKNSDGSKLGQKIGFKHSEESKIKIQIKTREVMNKPEMKEKMREIMRIKMPIIRQKLIGKKLSEKTKEKIRLNNWMRGRTGEKHPRWVGGITYYRGHNWKLISREILIRDNYICQECGEKAVAVHHIIPYVRKNKKHVQGQR